MDTEDNNKPTDLKLDPKLNRLIKGIHEYKPNLPVKLIKKVLNEIGFETQDKNVYKFVALMADRILDEISDSLTQIKQQCSDEKKLKKNRKILNEKLVSTKDIILELDRLGAKIEDTNPYPLLKGPINQK